MIIIISILLFIFIVTYFLLENIEHRTKLKSVKHRIHVNGIRGKSSVTRLIAGVLREAGLKTIGKTTGNDTNIISHRGEDIKVHRKGPPSVFENVHAIRKHISGDVDAIVFECMAIQPQFQRFLEHKVVKSKISVITNVWEDHTAELGHTIEEIAMNLTPTIPNNGYLISAEENKNIQKLLKNECKKRNSKFVNALNYDISDSYISSFPYIEHKENIQIGLAVADLLKINEKKALEGMKKITPDSGAIYINETKIDDKSVIWINLFAANDKQSIIKNVNILKKKFRRLKPAYVSLLNNRADRPDRAKQFSKIIISELEFDHVATIGELEKQMVNIFKKNNYKNIIPLSQHKNSSGKTLVKKIIKKVHKNTIVIFGMANVHTKQAQSILKYFGNGGY